MTIVGLFFLTLPLILPDRNDRNWIGNSVLIVPGMMIFYVEGWLWYHRWKHRHRTSDSTVSTNRLD